MARPGRVRGRRGRLQPAAGPGLVAILALAALFVSRSPPARVLGAGAGAGGAVAAVAVNAAWSLLPASRRRAREEGSIWRWAVFLIAGGAAAATIGPWLVVVLIGCGLAEAVIRHLDRHPPAGPSGVWAAPAIGAILGAAVTLARALSQPWQYAVLAAAAIAPLPLRRGVVVTLLAAAAVGVVVALAGGPLPP